MNGYLRPTAPIAPDALLPGDPGRALSLAQDLLASATMSNHARGLWGYFGETERGGRPLTVQSTGIGGPSAAIVLRELAALGVRRAIRVGTCSALGPGLELGTLAVVAEALADDGTSRALGSARRVEPAPGLSRALVAQTGAPAVRVASADVVDERAAAAAERAGALALEMGCAPLFALGRTLGIEVACVLAVVAVEGEWLADERLAEAELEMGRAGAAALAASPEGVQPAAELSSTSRRD